VPVTEPAVPIALAIGQAERLVQDARAGGGILGADLDGLDVPIAGMALISEGLATTIATSQAPGATFARSLMPDLALTEPGNTIFPTLAILALESDLLRALDAASKEAALSVGGRLAGWRAVSSAISECDRVLSQIQGEVDEFAAKTLKAFIDASPAAWYTPSYIWDPATRTGLDVPEVRRRAVTIHLVAYLTTLYPPWIPQLSADPPNTRKAVDNEAPIAGVVTVKVDAPLDPMQSQMLDCAVRNGVDSANSPLLRKLYLHPVTWTVEQEPAGLVITDSALVWDESLTPDPRTTPRPEFDEVFADTHLGEDGQTRLRYHTTSEPASDGEERTGSIVVRVSIERPEWEAVLAELNGWRISKVSERVGAIVNEVLRWDGMRMNLEHAVSSINRILAKATGDITVPVTFHESDLLALPNACSLITQQEAAAATGTAVLPGISQPATFDHLGTGNGCPFLIPNPDGQPGASQVRIDALDLGQGYAQTWATYEQGAADADLKSGELADIGDDDFYITAPEGSAILYVRRKNVVIVVTLLTPNGLAGAEQLARTALTRF
jgi:hypothetical protein